MTADRNGRIAAAAADPAGHARVTFVQFADPSAFPPIVNAVHLLAERGWEVQLVSLRWRDTLGVREPGQWDGIRLFEAMARTGRGGLAISFAAFIGRAVRAVVRARGGWLYVSDAPAAVAALAASWVLGVRILYHEHDSPGAPTSAFTRLAHRARARLARRADVVVLPNAERARLFGEATGRTDAIVAFNCPPRAAAEAGAPAPREATAPFRVVYHGSLSVERLPLGVVRAIARLAVPTELLVIGYETVGSRGFGDQLRATAAQAGRPEAVRLLGTLSIGELFDVCRSCDAGLSIMPSTTDDVNMRHMVGASNKAFINLACGLPLVVSDLPDWVDMYVRPGFGVACDPQDEDSVYGALATLAADRGRGQAMGEAGRRRVAESWNFETQFAPVLERLETPARTAGAPGRAPRAREVLA